MKMTLLVLFVLLFAMSASAQMVDEAAVESASRVNSIGIQPAPTPFSLLDLSRVKWSHSYSVSFFSGGNNSGSMGVLNTSMFYELSSDLSLAVNVGIAHNTGALWGDGNNNATVLPGFVLDYHPSRAFRLTVGVQRYAGYRYGYLSPYYHRSPYVYDPFGY